MFDTSQFLVQTLLDAGEISSADVQRAGDLVATTGKPIAEVLVSIGAITSRRLAIARAKICEYPFVDLSSFEVDIRNARMLPRSVAERFCAFPLFCVDGMATVALEDPLNLQAIDQIRQLVKMEVEPVLCETEPVRGLIARAYSMVRADERADSAEDAASDGNLTTGDEPIVAAVNQIIAGAIDARASDVHLNPDEHDLHVRYRVDGVLVQQQGPGRAAHAAMIQRLKVMANLDLTQTRRPQDGKFRFAHGESYVDVRLSLLPTIHGENAVLRLLRPASSIGSIQDLGMPADIAGWYAQLIRRPHGMILVTGPTGSGKTTTLYTALSSINSPELNIMTIEDPVELRLPLIRQIQANHEIGLNFASALRSILRQDPDVVLVGEIRDEETARIAVQAAMTGHLVFSTLHTNDAVGAVPRLRDLGVPDFAINSALLAVLAQRLVRKVCPKCAATYEPDDESLGLLGLSRDDAWGVVRAEGCPDCHGLGYKGRVGVYEMLRVTDRLRRLIEAGEGTSELLPAARAEGMRLIWEDGLDKARRGETTLDELGKLRTVVNEDVPPMRAAA
ncbi:MAG: type II/IV secretion system protein [Phycisphaeraceae bacterium]|nr:type II/IV secretion system protein [Phycisphaeraceae bacterium]